MMSCTEFIATYSELFTFLEKKHGREEVERFWQFLFEPDGKGIPLIRFVEREGIRGCYSYWTGTLNEEAADFTMYLNEKAGWFHNEMHHCPSKGRLLELKDEIGLEPYRDYCLHCDYYRKAIEKVGLVYLFNFIGTDRASCSMTIYDPKLFDGRIIPDENTVIMDRKASDNEYFHRDFHSSLNMGVHYLGTRFGVGEIREYLRTFTENVYRPLFGEIRKRGLDAIADKILDTYEKEKASDAVSFERDDGKVLTVNVAYCPAVKHLKATGRRVSEWYSLTTEVVMERLAREAGADFEMLSYDEETGAARYRFTEK